VVKKKFQVIHQSSILRKPMFFTTTLK